MSPSCLARPTRKIAGSVIVRLTIAGLLTGLFLPALTAPLFAVTTSESASVREPGPIYDAAHEITLHGVIQELVTARVIGSPVGAHLLVSGPQGVIDVHAGPYLSKETLSALQSGTPVHVVGAMVSLHGKQYLLARLLTMNGQTLTLRSESGILLHQHGERTTKSTKNARVETNGDIR